MILSDFSWKWLQNDEETTGFIRVPWLHFAVTQSTCFPMNFKVLQHRENASRNAYKRNAFLMILSDFSRKWLQHD